MATALDLSVYLVTDRQLCGSRGVFDTVRMAVSGGATIVQLRDPDAPTRALVDEARLINALLRTLAIPLIINDRVDVALAAGAAGVHLGQDDMTARDARELLGPDAIIGISVGNPTELNASADDIAVVDYVGVGPFGMTGTKADAGAAIGAQGLLAVRDGLDVPIVAIGGINMLNAGDAIRAGADGVAVVSAICASSDPVSAARDLARIVEAARPGDDGILEGMRPHAG